MNQCQPRGPYILFHVPESSQLACLGLIGLTKCGSSNSLEIHTSTLCILISAFIPNHMPVIKREELILALTHCQQQSNGPQLSPDPSSGGNKLVGLPQAPKPWSLGTKTLEDLVPRQTQTQAIWRILFPCWRAKLTPPQRQNLRGLNLLFTEAVMTWHDFRRITCYFYANHLGVIKVNLAMFRKKTKKWRKGDVDQIIGINLCLPSPHG